MDTSSRDSVKRIQRRTFLGGLLSAAGAVTLSGAALGFLADPADATVPSSGIASLKTATGRTILRPTVAKDGLPALFLAGVLDAVTKGSIVVRIPQRASQQIEVLYTSNTKVNAGGEVLNGDLAMLSLGDRVNIGDLLNASGKRVATYINANVVIAWVIITSTDTDGFSGTLVKNQRSHMAFRYASNLDALPAQPPQPGEIWHVWATSSAPSSPGTVWAQVMTLGQTRSRRAAPGLSSSHS